MKLLGPDISVKTNLITVHGIKTKGDNLYKLSEKLKKDLDIDKVTNINYRYLLASLNYLPWVRNILQEYLAARLSLLTYKYPKSKTLILAHSNGTWMLGKAIERYHSKFRIDNIFLFGSVLKRNFNWGRYPEAQVINFIGGHDKVLLFSKTLYGMGWSGRYGFKRKCSNLKQFRFNWGHTGYMEEYGLIKSFASKSLGMEKEEE
jgi:hypothetical protein